MKTLGLLSISLFVLVAGCDTMDDDYKIEGEVDFQTAHAVWKLNNGDDLSTNSPLVTIIVTTLDEPARVFIRDWDSQDRGALDFVVTKDAPISFTTKVYEGKFKIYTADVAGYPLNEIAVNMSKD